jgi:hypothetical protein
MATPMQLVSGTVLKTYAQLSWGFQPLLLDVIIERLGGFGAAKWMVQYLPRYEAILKRLGPSRGHLLCALASLLNGCPYCTHAHGRALNLYFFRDQARLFPLDEEELVQLSGIPDSELMVRVNQMLEQAGMEADKRMLQRLWAIKFEGDTPKNDFDADVQHAVAMFDVLNACALVANTPRDDAHDPIRKDRALVERYEAALKQKRAEKI